LVGGDPTLTGGSGFWRTAVALRVWHLAQRKIFSEAPRREILGSTAEQSMECATCRVWADRTARKIDRHIGAPESLFQVGSVLHGRTQQNRHSVKRNSFAGQRQSTTGNFNAFAAFSRGGKDDDLLVELRQRRSHHIIENVTLKSSQRSIVFLAEFGRILFVEIDYFCPSDGPETCECNCIARWNRDERLWTARANCPEQGNVGGGRQRNVQQQRWNVQ
jgi:hypothetical protein